MGDSNKSFIESWIAQQYTWDLTVAVKILLGIDPAKDKSQIDLSGNEKASRIYAWAIKKIKEKELTAVSEEVSDTGETEYRVLRDDFVPWAYKNYKTWAQPLYAAWKSYKVKKKKWTPSEEIQKRSAEWQEQLDKLYLDFDSNSSHSGNYHSHHCMDLAKKLNPGLTDEELKSRAETIRRYTRRRDRAWILGKMGKK